MRKLFLRTILLLFATGFLLIGYGYYEATKQPIARLADINVKNWPIGTPDYKIILLADTQVAGPDMTPERLDQIVQQINRHEADLILMAGDYISEKSFATQYYTAQDTIEPLTKLRAVDGVIAVMGNHDYWADEAGFIQAFEKSNITLLRNEAITRGPINIIGIDDEYTRHDDVKESTASLAKLTKAPNIVVTHAPDVIPDIQFDTAVILAGHTHCGQIRFPFIGPVATFSRYGNRFDCGLINDNGRDIIITAGLGTSIIPLRIGAPPDYWIITLKGA